MNWLRKISEQADQMVGTLDATLQQPVTDTMVFKPLHQADLSGTNGLTSAVPGNLTEPCADPCAPSGGEPVHQDEPVHRDETRPAYTPRLQPV